QEGTMVLLPAPPRLPLLERAKRDLFDDWFRALWRAPWGTEDAQAADWGPAVELTEENGGYRLTAELPGIRREDIEITLEDNVLTLKGQKQEEKEEKDKHYYLSERRYGEFQRSFLLPRSVATDEIRAELKDGVLTLFLPKVQEAVGRKIEIQAS